MKRYLLMIFLAGLTAGLRAAGPYRDFTNTEGKTIRGAVKAYDARTKTVTIQRENKRTAKVPISVFCEDDQRYVLEWDGAQDFLSDTKLRISGERKQVDKRKEAKEEDITMVGGGGDTERVTIKETYFEKIAFELELSNRGASALKEIRIVYIIYYEQSEEGWEKPIVLQKHFRDQGAVPFLDVAGKVVFTTKPVEVFTDNVVFSDWAGDRTLWGGKGEVHGMRARLYLKMESGNEVMREFCYPEKFSAEKYPWKE